MTRSVPVTGTGNDQYHVYNAAGQSSVIYNRPLNRATELLPGTYTVLLNGSRQRVTVDPGQRVEAAPGNLMVTGTGSDYYTVHDATGQEVLTSTRRTNQATELFPGTYTVRLGDQSHTVQIQAGRRTTVSP